VSKKNGIPIPRDHFVKRIKRLEVQIRGIEKMISEERDCVNIIVQLAAVRSGIEGVGPWG
jgi:DNA-binding FrmR family transcriptional regulator